MKLTKLIQKSFVFALSFILLSEKAFKFYCEKFKEYGIEIVCVFRTIFLVLGCIGWAIFAICIIIFCYRFFQECRTRDHFHSNSDSSEEQDPSNSEEQAERERDRERRDRERRDRERRDCERREREERDRERREREERDRERREREERNRERREREKRDRERREKEEREEKERIQKQQEQEYYKILGINHDASEKDIKAARNKLSLYWHPDKLRLRLHREPTNEEIKEADQKMKKINEAYEFLEKRDHERRDREREDSERKDREKRDRERRDRERRDRERRDRERREREEREEKERIQKQQEQEYYKILGINHDASEKDIKAARNKLSLYWHPDKLRLRLHREPTNEEIKEADQKMKKINEAYEFLERRDRERRDREREDRERKDRENRDRERRDRERRDRERRDRERRDRERREREEREEKERIQKQQEQEYYKILGINHDASEKDIKAARNKLSLYWHPDKLRSRLCREPTNEEIKEADQKMKEINEAYEFLSDSTRYYENMPFS